MLPPVTIIVLNWNGRSLLPDCLHALENLTYPAYEIVVVDNQSTDDSVTLMQQQFPHIRLVESGGNLGFSRGNNLILRQLDTPFAALVNPDLIVRPDWLTALISPMLTDPQIGITGSKLFYPDGRLQHAGGYIRTEHGMPGHYGLGEPDDGRFDTARPVPYVIGAALAIRKETVLAIGGFDEAYFLYYEDADLCWSAREAGFTCWYVPTACAVHLESAVSGKESGNYLRHFHTGRWRFLLKHFAWDELLSDARPLEEKWSSSLGPRPRPYLAAVYQTTRAALPAILGINAQNGRPAESKQSQQLMQQWFLSLEKKMQRS